MLMRLPASHNCIPTRAHAALVALLYVFLCTFGMVTHTHGPGDVHPAPAAVRSANVSSVAVASTHGHATIGERTLARAAHCAFCDWQASNQARTVAVWHYVALPSFVTFYVPCHAPPARVLSVPSSSRAPPASV